MILNVSSRTDIVAFYTDWFMNRYKEGFIDVRNPFYKNNVSRIYFKDVDLILFCTKNPLPIIDRLKEINIPIIFHITLTPYKNEIEKTPPKGIIVESVKKISNIIGADNVYIRYDPIFISPKYNLEYHIKAFNNLCSLLNGYTNKIIISFIDDYKNVRKNFNELKIIPFNNKIYQSIGENFSKIAKKYNMTVQTCFEKIDLCEYGFIKSECLSKELALKLTGKKFKTWKSRGCKCAEMVDIGVYNTCKHFCKYCYANYDENKVIENIKLHNSQSSLLIGNLQEDDIIKVRK